MNNGNESDLNLLKFHSQTVYYFFFNEKIICTTHDDERERRKKNPERMATQSRKCIDISECVMNG